MTISLQPVKSLDADFIRNLRNQEFTYRYLKNPKSVSVLEHKKWFKKRIETLHESPMFIIQVQNRPAGIARLDFLEKQNAYEAGIMIAEEFSGRGVGNKSLQLLLKYAVEQLLAKRIIAHVRLENSASIKLFRNNGFVEMDTNNSNKLNNFIVLEYITNG